jgi:hypothetical protein
MKKILTTIMFAAALLLFGAKPVQAQAFEDAGQYIDYISKANEQLSATYLSYLSAVAHNKSARKQEKRRSDVVTAIFNTRTSIQGMPPWKGDRTYKDPTVAYLKILNIVFNEDYAKIVNMEEIAEQSYDGMEAYLLAQEKAGDKLQEAAKKQHEITRVFAKKYNVNLVEGETETSLKSKTASAVNKHYHEVYLVFFKPYKQDAYLIDALEKANLVAIEQNISSLEKMAREGLEKLDNIKPYNNDPIVTDACRKALEFYKSEALRSKGMSDFILKKEKFEKTKKLFDSKRSNDRTQKDIDDYNNAVNDMNASLKGFNDLNNQLNKERTEMLNNWNKKVSRYFDDNMPVQKKQSQN